MVGNGLWEVGGGTGSGSGFTNHLLLKHSCLIYGNSQNYTSWSGHIKCIRIPNHAANIKTLIFDILSAGFSQTEQLLMILQTTYLETGRNQYYKNAMLMYFKCNQGIHRLIGTFLFITPQKN